MYHYLSIRIIENKDTNKKLKRPNDDENREQLEFSFMVARKVKKQACHSGKEQFLIKFKIHIPYDLAILLQSICPREVKICSPRKL